MSKLTNYYSCPECKGILTNWSIDAYVCDVCGYGKNSHEDHIKLQKIKVLVK